MDLLNILKEGFVFTYVHKREQLVMIHVHFFEKQTSDRCTGW